MTNTVTTVTIQSILTGPYGLLSNGLGVIALILLLLVLFERVLLEAFLGKPRPQILRVFDVCILPLILILGILVGLRLANLLGILTV